MFKEPAPGITEEGSTTVVSSGTKPITVSGEKDMENELETTIVSRTTHFVQILAFSTTPGRLDRAFRSLPSIFFALVQMKLDPKKPGGKLSMGCGFVGFEDTGGAEGSEIDARVCSRRARVECSIGW